MSPREVQGLQSLAQTQGQSLTINPQTGLPEAGILDNLLPAIAGFALNAFAPGIGGAIGSALGLGEGLASTVGTGLLVGGATGLASGSLEKGLMAGLGAYGGAGLGGALNSAGEAALAGPPVSASNLASAAQASPVGTIDRLQAGAGAAMNAPGDFLDKNKWNLLAAGAPALMDSFGGEEETPAAKPNPGYIRKYARDPATGSLYQVSATPADQYTAGGSYGGVPAPVKYGASGGLMQHYETGGTTYGGVGALVDANGNPINPATEKTISDSQRAQDYLLGKPGATNPFLFYHQGPAAAAAAATKPTDALSTAGILALTPQAFETLGSRGLSQEQRDEKNDPNAWGNLTDQQQSAYFADNPNMAKATQFAQGLWNNSYLGQLQNWGDPSIQARYQAIQDRANEARQMNDALRQSATYGTNLDNSGLSTVRQNPYETMRSDVSAPAPAAEQNAQDARIAAFDASRESPRGGGGYGGGDGGDGGSSFGGVGAHAYSYGGGITALAEGGMYNLGSYSDGGRLLKGPGDGVSDDIPATIGENQPARLADGEFVVPARIVSELGNGSTEAGARKLYAMMDRVQKARSKTVGKDKVAANSRADKYLPV